MSNRTLNAAKVAGRKRPLKAHVVPADGTCNARKSDGSGLCGLLAGHETEHPGYGRCRFHGGLVPTHQAGAALDEFAAVMGLGFVNPIDMRPAEALLWTVQLSAGAVAWLRQKLDSQGEGQMVGHVYGESGRIKEAAPSVWIKLYNEERDRLTKNSKICLDAGIAERQVRIAEQQGQIIAGVIKSILDNLRLVLEAENMDVLKIWKGELPGIVRTALQSMPTERVLPSLAEVREASDPPDETINWD